MNRESGNVGHPSAMRRMVAVTLLLFCTVAVAFLGAQTTTPAHRNTQVSKHNFIYVGIESSATFVVISPTGKMAGFENNARVTDIPFSASDEDCSDNAEKPKSERVCSRRIEIGNPISGEYRIDITGAQNGTYNLWLACDLHGEMTERRYSKVPIVAGEKHTYTFSYDTSGRPVELRRMKAR